MRRAYLLLFCISALIPDVAAQVQLQNPELALSVIATDSTRAKVFYQDCLGLVPAGRFAATGVTMHLYNAGQGTVKVRVYNTDPPYRDPALLASNGIRFITIPVAQFDTVVARLVAHGFAPPAVRTEQGVRTGIAQDGDGNVVELLDAATAAARKLEIGLIVTDVDSAKAFYERVLGFPVAAPAAGPPPVDGAAEFRYRANNTVIHFFAPSGSRPTYSDGVASGLGYRYITFTVKADVDLLYQRMLDSGYSVASPLAPYGASAYLFMIHGPGGAIHEFVGPISSSSSCMVSKTSVRIPEGGTETLNVWLSTLPNANVNVSLARSNGDADLKISPSTLLFTPSNWNAPQTITLTATQDADHVNGTANFSVSITGSSTKLYVSAEEVEPASGDWTDMKFTSDYFAPSINRQYPNSLEGKTLEAMDLCEHDGKLYCATSYVATQDPSTSDPKILVKDSPSSPWRIEYQAGNSTTRLACMRSVAFTRDHNGRILNPPVKVLLCGTGAWWGWNPDGVYILSRGPSGVWDRTKITEVLKNPDGNNDSQELRVLFDYVDTVANRHLVFSPCLNGNLYSGVFNSTTGKVVWNKVPEIYDNGGRGLGFAVANGVLYLAQAYGGGSGAARPTKNYGLWRRIDGLRNPVDAKQTAPPTANPQWEWVPVTAWDDPAAPGTSLRRGQIRGLTALPDPKGGTHEVLGLHWDVPDGKLEIVDPSANFQATVELDTKAFSTQQWGSGGSFITLGYNDWCPAVHPHTKERVHLIGVWANYPAGELASDLGKSSWLIIRSQDPVTHRLLRIWDMNNPLAGAEYGLRGCRSIKPSPFPEEKNRVWYFCGFDGTGIGVPEASGSRAWIYKGTMNYTTAVDEKAHELPAGYLLEQNHPNPFNPSTVISYHIPIAGHVTLKVYDVIGREFATLVDEFQQTGNHSTLFTLSSSFASGIYFYQLKTRNFSETKKMMVIK